MIENSIKTKKIDDNTTLHYVEHSNDPIAITRSRQERYSKKKVYSTSWHPDFRSMHPVVDQLRNRNFAEKSSAADAFNHVFSKYQGIVDSPEEKLKDPLQAEFVGEATQKIKSQYSNDSTEHKFNDYELKDSEGNHVANLRINPDYEKYVGTEHRFFSDGARSAHLKFPNHDEVIKSESYKTALAKHSDNDPISLMARAKYWHENKDREPNFRGKWFNKEGSTVHKVYSTKLSPEDASLAYEKHLRDTNKLEGVLTRHSPTFFTIHKLGEGYSYGRHEIVDSSVPGELTHHSSSYSAPTLYDAKTLNHVIE